MEHLNLDYAKAIRMIKIESGHMAIYGQHAIHQDAGYLERNLRYFRYLDFKSKF